MAPVTSTLLLAEEGVFVLTVGPSASMSIQAVTSRLWNRSPLDCCGRILTSSAALGEMPMPIQIWPRFSAAAERVQDYVTGRSWILTSWRQNQILDPNSQGPGDCREGFGSRAVLSPLNAGERHPADPGVS